MSQGLSSPASRPVGLWERVLRVCLLLSGMSGLVTGIWGGLLRIGWNLPLPVHHANWITFHGPLMVCGFLGTLIGLERAVGLRAGWTWWAPLLAGAGGVLTEAGVLGWGPRLSISAGSAVFLAVAVRILMIQRNLANVVQMLGAGAWLAGNVAWCLDRPVAQVVPAWMAFLLLIIAGERLELTRFAPPDPWAARVLLACLAVLGAGLVFEAAQLPGRNLLLGAALAGTAVWLLRFDLAWRTIRSPGLPRYMAISLLSGYGWLLISGVWMGLSWPQTAGVAYDGMLHAFFVGFVFAMIFGHAPVIFPAILGVPVVFHPAVYFWWAALQVSLVLRLAADGLGWAAGRSWGAAGNGVAIAGFLLTMLVSWGRGWWRARRAGAGAASGR